MWYSWIALRESTSNMLGIQEIFVEWMDELIKWHLEIWLWKILNRAVVEDIKEYSYSDGTLSSWPPKVSSKIIPVFTIFS